MSTNNFENAKNGIFVIEPYEPMSYEEWLEDMGYSLDEGKNNPQLESDYESYSEDDDTIDMAVDDTIGNIISDLEAKGYETTELPRLQPNEYKVTGKGINGQIGLRIEGGYYSGAQIIVTTQRDEQLMNANMSEEDIIPTLYDFTYIDGTTEMTEDKEDFENDKEYRLHEVLHNVIQTDYDEAEPVLSDVLPDDKAIIGIVSQYTTPIKKVGGFSNGEALYEKI